MKRLICLFRGHVNGATILPEDHFGLYAFSRLYCLRCGRTQAQLTPAQVEEARQQWVSRRALAADIEETFSRLPKDLPL